MAESSLVESSLESLVVESFIEQLSTCLAYAILQRQPGASQRILQRYCGALVKRIDTDVVNFYSSSYPLQLD